MVRAIAWCERIGIAACAIGSVLLMVGIAGLLPTAWVPVIGGAALLCGGAFTTAWILVDRM